MISQPNTSNDPFFRLHLIWRSSRSFPSSPSFKLILISYFFLPIRQLTRRSTPHPTPTQTSSSWFSRQPATAGKQSRMLLIVWSEQKYLNSQTRSILLLMQRTMMMLKVVKIKKRMVLESAIDSIASSSGGSYARQPYRCSPPTNISIINLEMYYMNRITLPSLIDKQISNIPLTPPSPTHTSTANPHPHKQAVPPQNTSFNTLS